MYPELDQLRRLERETLRAVSELGEFAKLFELQTEAKRAVNKINESRGPVDVNLGFMLDIRLRGDKLPTPRRVDVGALVRATPDNKRVLSSSYSLIICRDSDPSTSPIVRKIHFDYEPVEHRNHAEPKPSMHMQICGKFSPHHREAGYPNDSLTPLYPAWERPRIPMTPTSLALLLNWLLVEFQSDPASQAALRSPRWRKLVSQAERTVLLPYYSKAVEFLKGTAHTGKVFALHYQYEMGSD